MSQTSHDTVPGRRPLRLWPGVAIVIVQLALQFILPLVAPDAAMLGVLGGALGCVLVFFVWWLFFSRAAWIERLGALLLVVAAMALTKPLLDKSIATGAMGMLFFV